MTDFPFTEHQLRWIEALESGAYTQCQGRLRRGEPGDYSYCCLGVATELNKEDLPKNMTKSWAYHPGMPEPIQKKLQLYDNTGGTRGVVPHALWELNDVDDFSFTQIAKRLRDYPEVYFTNLDKE